MNIQDDPSTLQLIVSLASSGDFKAAMEKAETLGDRTARTEAWREISRANANMQRWDEARQALEIALQQAPGSAAIRLDLALLAERRGRHAESLTILEALARHGVDEQLWLVHLARALQFAGRADEAESRLEAALARRPVDVALHSQLAQLRWQRGAGEKLTASLERAIAEYPHEMPLRLIAAELLRTAGFPERALRLLEQGLAMAPDSVTFMTSVGVMLDDLGRADEALQLLRAAVRRSPHSVNARRNLVPALIRARQEREALELLEGLSATAPDDQQLIAWRATAMRLQGDPGYALLHDYPRLVRAYDLVPTQRFADIAAFNSALARELEPLHRTRLRPLAQSLRGGSQTDRNLPSDPVANPAIAAFFDMLDAPLRDYIARLIPGSDHPTDRRRRDGYRFAGSWSVQLQPGGFHVSHVHPMGWLSSAYYVEVPGAGGGSRAGWLKFGEPGMVNPPCGPDHLVEPRPGLLVLFPSYMWHGTVPFTEGGRRLTAVFDALPA